MTEPSFQRAPIDQRRITEGMILFAVFVASIFAANYAIGHIGTFRAGPDGPWMIPVFPGIAAPSGVLFAGLTLTCRDLVQRRLGVGVSLLAVLIGALVSWSLDPSLAVASVGAFTLAELLDLAVYTPLQRRNLVAAVLASNVVGLIADTVVFLTIAFGSLQFFEGQLIGKAWATLIVLPVIAWLRRMDERRGMPIADRVFAF